MQVKFTLLFSSITNFSGSIWSCSLNTLCFICNQLFFVSKMDFGHASHCNGKLWYSNIHRFCNSTCSEILPKIRLNLTWHANMLKMKYLPEKHLKKSEIAAREERTQETTEKTYFSSEKHGIVPIPKRSTLL